MDNNLLENLTLDDLTISSDLLDEVEILDVNKQEDPLLKEAADIKLNIVGDIFSFTLDEADNSVDPDSVIINEEFINRYTQIVKIADNLYNQIAEFKQQAKEFIEEHNLGSIVNDKMTILYSPKTTTTSVDTTALKRNEPEIAARYSVTKPRASSVQVKVKED